MSKVDWINETFEGPLLLADGFEDAIIGVCERPQAVAYDYERCIGILQERDGMDYHEAVEFFEFNTVGAYMGEHTPVFIQTP